VVPGVENGALAVSIWIFSGLKSPALSVIPPRSLIPVAPAPNEATTSVSPKPLVLETACGVSIVTRMPSSDSQKSIPSFCGS
jgi:hypothetical protein